jgi:hypothetical protein
MFRLLLRAGLAAKVGMPLGYSGGGFLMQGRDRSFF